MTLSDRLSACYTGAIFDAMRDLGVRGGTLPHGIRAIDPELTVAGPVFTVSGHRDDAVDAHETLMRWTGFLSAATAGSVVVCQPRDHTLAHMGELSSETLHHRGVRGYIVDGGCRDTGFILRIRFPVFCRYQTPADIVGRWVPDAFGEPITIGDATIREGDYVVGDRDGVVYIPRDMAASVAQRSETLMNTENKVRRAILDGQDPQQAYLEHGVF